jgi:predicted RNase H-like HicB family nuclease
MLYPVYIHVGDHKHAHGVVFPDFPGCFSAADTWDELPSMIQEAAESYFFDGATVPPPSKIEVLANDPAYQGGLWMLFDIDVARLSQKSVRINISLPEYLVSTMDAYAKTQHLSRSAFIAKAALGAIGAKPRSRQRQPA